MSGGGSGGSIRGELGLKYGTMTQRLLEDWCRGMDMNPRKALLVAGIPTTCGVTEIEEALQAGLAPLGEYRLLGRMFRRDENKNVALIGLKIETNSALVPREIPGKGSVWRVIFKSPNADNEFLCRLNEFLQGEGVTIGELTRVLGNRNDPLSLDQAMIPDMRAPVLAQALDEARKPPLQCLRYKKLSIFSGRDPPGPGEKNFESWMFHTCQVMKTWHVSDIEKRRRLIESLRGPAFEIIRVLKKNNPFITVAECLKSLETIFGIIDNPRALQVRYLTTYQKDNEKLSEYVLRLEPLLQRLAQKGLIEREILNQARLDQIVAGAVHKTVRRELGLPEGAAPTLLQLLSLINDKEAEEEEEEEALQAELEGCFT